MNEGEKKVEEPCGTNKFRFDEDLKDLVAFNKG